MPFIDARINQDKEFGFVGGPEFRTDIKRLQSGRTKRHRMWDYPLHRYTADYATFDQAERAAFLNWFMVAAGSWATFRFRDKNDYQAVDQVIGVGDGTNDPMQLVRNYEIPGVAGMSLTRPITLPLNAVITDALDNVVPATVDPLTGLATPTGTWPMGQALKWNGEFDVRVCMAMDYNPLNKVEGDIDEVTIELVEDRG